MLMYGGHSAETPTRENKSKHKMMVKRDEATSPYSFINSTGLPGSSSAHSLIEQRILSCA